MAEKKTYLMTVFVTDTGNKVNFRINDAREDLSYNEPRAELAAIISGNPFDKKYGKLERVESCVLYTTAPTEFNVKA